MAAAVAPGLSSPSSQDRRGETSRQGTDKSRAQSGGQAAIDGLHRIHATLAPRIAVINSPDVDDLLAVNNIDSLAEFLRPFEDAAVNIAVRTSQLETRQCPTFPMHFDDLDAFYPSQANAAGAGDDALFTPADIVSAASAAPESPQQGRRRRRRRHDRGTTYARPEMLLDAIGARIRAKSRALWALREEAGEGGAQNSRARDSDAATQRGHQRNVSKAYDVTHGLGLSSNSKIQDFKSGQLRNEDEEIERYRRMPIEELTPWFTDMRDMVLAQRTVAEHETFGHPVAVIMAVSSSSADPLNAFTTLYEASQATVCPAFSQRPYVDPLVFRYYLLIHDVAKMGPDLQESIALLDSVKKTYGIHCCLLQLNSAASSQAQPNVNPNSRSKEISDLWRSALIGKKRNPNGDAHAAKDPQTPSKNGQRHPDDSIDSQLSVAWHEDAEGRASTEEYATLIDADDVKRIRTFVRDFTAQSLIPFMERCVSLWNEQLAASRKGLTSRLFGAGRKLFGATARGAQGQSQMSFASLGYYQHSSLEAQTRRLADFAFMTRDYRLAAAMYDYGRRDYLNDKAFRFSAGANEMFGLSHLMMMLCNSSALIDVDSYLATATHDYLLAPRQSGSALQLDGLRSTLLYYECYRALNFYRAAPVALVRTANQGTSGSSMDDLEVVAGTLLEQAALAAVRQPLKPALRKCALHLVMAAHRYGNCGQKHLSLRSFHSAAFCYRLLHKTRAESGTEIERYIKDGDVSDLQERDRRLGDDSRLSDHLQSWKYIDDHMELELAQQAYNDGRTEEAVRHYLLLLQQQGDTDTISSFDDLALRHEMFFTGFVTCARFLSSGFPASLKHLDIRPSLNIIDVKETRIGVNAVQLSRDKEWQKLGSLALGRTVAGNSKYANSTAIYEPFCVHVAMRNPFCISLSIQSISLIFVDADSSESINDDSLQIQAIDEVIIQPREERLISINVTSTTARTLRCSSVTYKLNESIAFVEGLGRNGLRLNETKQQRTSRTPQYAPSSTMTVVVRENDASLHASFPIPSSRMVLGEEVRRSIVLKNAGRNALRNVRAFASPADAVLSSDVRPTMPDEHMEVDNNLGHDKALPIRLPGDLFAAQSSFAWEVTLRGASLGQSALRILLVYETESGDVFTTQVQHALFVDAILDIGIQAVPTPAASTRSFDARIWATSFLEASGSVTIKSLSVISPSWRLLKMQNRGPFIEGLTSGRQYDNIVSLCESDSSNPAITLESTVRQLTALLRGREVNMKTSPSPSAVTLNITQTCDESQALSPFYGLARRRYRMSSLAHQFPSLANEDDGRDTDSMERVKRIFMLYEPADVDVVVNWQIDGTRRSGQSFIFGLRIGPLHDYLGSAMRGEPDDAGNLQRAAARTMYAETDRHRAALASEILRSSLSVEEDPILLEILVPYDVTVEENFEMDEGRSQTIEVKLVLKNLSNLRTRQVVLQLDNSLPMMASTASPRDSALSSELARPTIASYINRLTLRTTLAPSACRTLSAQARVSKLGRHILAPILLHNTPAPSDPEDKGSTPAVPWHEFQRWEHCATIIDVRRA